VLFKFGSLKEGDEKGVTADTAQRHSRSFAFGLFVLLPERQLLLKRVLDFIEAHLASDISLDDLAAEACLSPFHFSRLFREATGLSPCRYVTDRRIQAAQKMLAVDQSSLVQVALDTGFGSQAAFTRAFRKTTGLTPGQYRELCLR
jgi:AraC family transcriptional regulator